MTTRVVSLIAALTLAACASGSNYNAPSTSTPQYSTGQSTPGTISSSATTPSQSTTQPNTSTQTTTTTPTTQPAKTQTATNKPTSTATRSPSATKSTSKAPTPTRTATTTTRPPLTTAPAITWPTKALSGKDFTAIPTTKKVIALTFDAGGNNAGVKKILATLSAKKVSATFFFTGNWINVYPNDARTIASTYLVGNHTQTHPYLTKLTDAQVRSEITKCEQTMKATTGRNPNQIFRFPYGATNTHLINVVNTEGYVSVRWTVDTLGWKGTSGGQSTNTVNTRVMDAAKPGAIVLMHVGGHPTDKSTLDADALPQMIDRLKALGYTFVNLNAFLP